MHGEQAAATGQEVVEDATELRVQRLDLVRPVPRDVIEDCLRIALQAPSGRNRQRWDFIFVEDPQTRAAVARLWRLGLMAPPPASGGTGPAFSRMDFATDFKPGPRADADSFAHWDRW
ncbi:nitroreductase family protein [Micromonospora sp. NPDC023888]|uniref:nitroreductase family protein n=1 Tax=Micromonospora sp. NPDC023888 TaxID=3155607 RepID=UPI0033EF49C3